MAKEAKARLQAWVKRKNLRLVKSDAKKFNRTLDAVADKLLQDFLLLKIEDRAKVYAKLPSKQYGRPAEC